MKKYLTIILFILKKLGQITGATILAFICFSLVVEFGNSGSGLFTKDTLYKAAGPTILIAFPVITILSLPERWQDLIMKGLLSLMLLILLYPIGGIVYASYLLIQSDDIQLKTLGIIMIVISSGCFLLYLRFLWREIFKKEKRF